MPHPDDLTDHLAADGGSQEADALLPLVYDRLRAFTARLIGPGLARVVDPTSIVHEAYIALVDQLRADEGLRVRFFAIAARAVRRILVDHVRRERAARRGGDRERVTLCSTHLGRDARPVDLMDLDAALAELEAVEPRAARLVVLRFFGGLTMPEVAAHTGVSVSTCERDWRFARAWLYERLADPDDRTR